MTELIPFQYSGRSVRAVAIAGDPWFVARDVCAELDIVNVSDAVSTLDDDEKGVVTADTLGGPQQIRIVSEAGLYSLILRSRKPEAKAFKRWVTHEVLPAIRKTGQYSVTSVGRRELAEMVIAEADRADQAEAKLIQQAPAVEAFETYMDADNAIKMGAVANQLGIGRNTMMRELRDAKVLQRDNRPYQRYAHHFKVVATTYEASDETRATHTTYVKPSGVELIRRVLSGGRGLVSIEGGAAS